MREATISVSSDTFHKSLPSGAFRLLSRPSPLDGSHSVWVDGRFWISTSKLKVKSNLRTSTTDTREREGPWLSKIEGEGLLFIVKDPRR